MFANINPSISTQTASPILVGNDSTVDIAYLAGLLNTLGYTAVTAMTDSRRVIQMLGSGYFDLILQRYSAAELPNLFDLFLTSGVHLKYANKFLIPEQIDAVDINTYLGPVDAT